MNICVIGTGYVGLVVGTGLADSGNEVICVDSDKEKIKDLNNNKIPIYERGLEELIKRNKEEGRLSFSSNLKEAVRKSKLVFSSVGTPPKNDGSVDLIFIYKVAEEIGDSMEDDDYKIIINKSTVPVGTARKIKEIIKKRTNAPFDVVSNPEFLKEGNAVEDFMKPNRIIIGTENPEVARVLKELYEPFVRTGNPIIIMGIESAEITKYACNLMLATRISLMNEVSNLCEKVGADVEEVRKGVGTDPRIGSKFLFPGVGYGGSCLPKDVKAFTHIGLKYKIKMRVAKAVDIVNENQKKLLYKKIKSHFGDLKNKKIAVWGMSFKPETDDIREAPSIVIINLLLREGANVYAYDPKALKNAKKIFKDKINYCKTPYECLKDIDALVLLTEWNEFRNPDFEKIGNLMRNKIIFDGRNIYNFKRLRELGFKYYGIGRI